MLFYACLYPYLLTVCLSLQRTLQVHARYLGFNDSEACPLVSLHNFNVLISLIPFVNTHSLHMHLEACPTTYLHTPVAYPYCTPVHP